MPITSQNILSFALKHGSTFGAYMVAGKILQLPMSTAELCKYSGIGASIGIFSHLAECSPARNDLERCPGCSVETDLKLRKALIRWVAGSFPFLTNWNLPYGKILGYSFLFSGAFEVATELLELCISSRLRVEISRASISSSGSAQASAAQSLDAAASYGSLGQGDPIESRAPSVSDLV